VKSLVEAFKFPFTIDFFSAKYQEEKFYVSYFFHYQCGATERAFFQE
jgi:hypothetical protein